MAAKKIAYDNDARERILAGIRKLARAVRVTLGPSGRVVILEKSFGAPTITKDGVTVAKEIELDDPYENMGAQMVKEVASKSSKDAGDGTTTATIYAEAIFAEGLKNITAGANANQVKRGIDLAIKAIVAELASMSKKISSSTEIAQVGTCAANQDENIGTIIAEAKKGKFQVIFFRHRLAGVQADAHVERGFERLSLVCLSLSKVGKAALDRDGALESA